ncbi:MAG: type II toxin-antitoxin system PemK/MazF family toxin [Gemmataceae bacterium]
MPSTTNYQAADLVLVDFPFSLGTQSKLRPALVLLDTGDSDILVARITTRPVATPFEVQLMDWRQAGLNAPSAVRLHKLATLEKNLIDRVLGRLEQGDRQKVSAILKQMFGAW